MSTSHRVSRRLLGLLVALLGVPGSSAQTLQQDLSFQPVLEFPIPAAGGIEPIALPEGGVLVSTSYDSIDGEPVARIARLLPNGRLDASFQPSVSGRTVVVAVYPDGRLLAGEPADWPQTGYLVRWRADGTLDPTFVPLALILTSPIKARLASDGRVWLTGQFSFDRTTTPGVALLNADGTRAENFTSPFAAGEYLDLRDLALQPDGKAVVLGSFTLRGQTAASTLVRLNGDGSVDPSFSFTGVNESYTSIMRLATGKFLLRSWTAVVRLNANGSIDTTYTPELPTSGLRVGRAWPSGRVYFVSDSIGGNPMLRRLGPDGRVDPSFQVAMGMPGDTAFPASWDETTFYVNAPLTQERAEQRQELTRLDMTGRIDAAFAPRFARIGSIDKVGRLADGRYLVSGLFDHVNGAPAPGSVIRLRSDGTLDAGFTSPPAVWPISFEPEGHFVARGDFGSGRNHARFKPDGSLDAVYVDPLQQPVADASGRVYVTESGPPRRLLRYQPNGTRDATYSPELPAQATQITPAPDGSVYFIGPAGTLPNQLRISRLAADGQIDPQFQPELIWGAPFALLALPDSTLLMVTRSSYGQYSYLLRFTRFSATGEPLSVYSGPANRATAAAALFDLLTAVRSHAPAVTSLSIELPEHDLASWMNVRADGEVTMLPGLQSFDETIALVRYLLDKSTTPVAPQAPVVSFTVASSSVEVGGSATFAATALGREPFTYQWYRNGQPIEGARSPNLWFSSVSASHAGTYAVLVTNSAGAAVSPAAPLSVGTPAVSVTTRSQSVELGGEVRLGVTVSGPTPSSVQWQRNDIPMPGATAAAVTLDNFQPEQAGLYTAIVSGGGATVSSAPVIAGLFTAGKAAGAAEEIASNIYVAVNGNTFDQVLLQGPAAAITADRPLNQITRLSYIDLDDDIVQVEFSGPGTLSLVLENASGPARPLHYNQRVAYMKGHASIIVTDADERSHLSVFTVGRATAYDPTGHFDSRQPISATNDPANNGNPLFEGHESTSYDGLADIAFVAIATVNGKFGSVRTANANYFASRGYTGVYAPDVAFTGPVYVGNITAFDQAHPVLRLGSVSDVRITGGDLDQPNDEPVIVSGIAKLTFTAGTDAQGRRLPAQANRAVLQESGIDVTAQLVVAP